MRFNFFKYVVLVALLVFGFIGCGSGGGSGSEPSESEMKDAMLQEMNHPPGDTVSDPVEITFFKKEACDAPTPQGYKCTFDVKVASRNIGASMYNNIPFAVFYKDSGKWAMRPPF
jgi:hypothetical protein